MEEFCAKCKKKTLTGEMTNEHIIPQWLIHNLKFLGVRKSDIISLEENKERYCRKCNVDKSGYIDWDHPKSRQAMEKLISILKENFDKGGWTKVPLRIIKDPLVVEVPYQVKVTVEAGGEHRDIFYPF